MWMTRAALFTVVLVVACRRSDDQRRASNDPRIIAISEDGDTALRVDRDDWRWYQARRDARCTLDEFLRRFHQPPRTQSDLQLKAGLEIAKDDTEHVWIRVLRIDDDSVFRGILNNDPSDSSRYKYGDTVVVARRQVTDWYAVDRDTLVGGFTIRVSRYALTKAERARFDSARSYAIGDDGENLRRLSYRCREATGAVPNG